MAYTLSSISNSSNWKLRENQIRKDMYKLTKAKHNIANIYKESLRSFIASFNDVGYIDSQDQFKEIKCIFGNPERTIAKLTQENNIILPMLSVSQTISDNDDDRRRNESVLVHDVVWDATKRRATRVLSFAPRPITIKYQVHIWAKYIADMDQILEQIRLKFNPEMQVPTKFSTLAKATLDSEDTVGDYTAADKEDRVLKKSISISLRTYIQNPKFLFTSTGKIEEFVVDSEVVSDTNSIIT